MKSKLDISMTIMFAATGVFCALVRMVTPNSLSHSANLTIGMVFLLIGFIASIVEIKLKAPLFYSHGHGDRAVFWCGFSLANSGFVAGIAVFFIGSNLPSIVITIVAYGLIITIQRNLMLRHASSNEK